MIRRRFALAALPIAVAVAPLAVPRLAMAATTITPDTFADVDNFDCADGHVAGVCSLRGAVIRADAESGDTIQLLAGTYTLSRLPDGDTQDRGDLEVQSTMTIKGAGATQTTITSLDPGNWNDRIIEVETVTDSPLVVANISDLKVTGGRAADQGENDGGGILNDSGELHLNNLIVDGNFAFGNGGGIASETPAQTTVSNTTISNNEAAQVAGALFLEGSISSADSVANVYIHDNTAHAGQQRDDGGGAVYAGLNGNNGSVAFTDLTIIHNHAPGMSGGGVYDNSFLPEGKDAWTNITIAGNDAVNQGGGFYVLGGRPVLTNATITDNHVTGSNAQDDSIGRGGGVAVGGRSGHITLNNATINANTASVGGGGVSLGNAGEVALLHNTILYGNTVAGALQNCGIRPGSTPTFTSTGYNLANDQTCSLTAAGDRQGSTFNPNLGVLTDNGGPGSGAPGARSATLTEELPEGSIAIDTADPNAANNPATDERHVTRPQGSASDVGAFETVPPIPTLPLSGAHADLWRLDFLLMLGLIAAVVSAMLVLVHRLGNRQESVRP
jgi:hypothetical protein